MSLSEQEEFEFRARAERERGGMAQTASPSMIDKLAGGRGTSLVYGLLSPAIAAAQAFGGEGTRKAIENFESSRERGKQALRREGIDLYELGGSVLPAAKIAGAVKGALPAATGLLGRMGIGAAQGAAIGAATPSSGVPLDEYFTTKGVQAATSGVAGGAVPLAIAAVKGIRSLSKQAVQPFTEKGRTEILKDLQEMLMGQDPAVRAKMIQAAAQAKPGVGGVPQTLGEALSDIPESTGLAAHQQHISRIKGTSPDFASRTAAQEAARADALIPIARNEGALAGEKAIRGTITDPLRNMALGRANLAGREIPQIESTIARHQQGLQGASERLAALTPPAQDPDANLLRTAREIYAPSPLPIPLRSQSELTQMKLLPEIIAKRQAGMQEAERALRTLSEQGFKPLRADAITKSIQGTLSQPGLRASDVVTKSLGALQEKLDSLKDARGVIDAHDLYMVRKEAGNTIKKFAEESKNFDQRLTAGLVSKMQSTIDDAIEGAGGTGWRGYLKKYQELSAGPSRMETGQALQKALQNPLETSERGQLFGKAVRDMDLSALADADRKSVQSIADELSRTDAFRRLAGKTAMEGSDAIPGRVGVTVPNVLYRPAMITNFMLKHVATKAEEKIAKEAAKQYLNPQAFARSMEDVPVRHRPLLEALLMQAPVMAATGTARNF